VEAHALDVEVDIISRPQRPRAGRVVLHFPGEGHERVQAKLIEESERGRVGVDQLTARVERGDPIREVIHDDLCVLLLLLELFEGALAQPLGATDHPRDEGHVQREGHDAVGYAAVVGFFGGERVRGEPEREREAQREGREEPPQPHARAAKEGRDRWDEREPA